jgi:hypothetical protein
LNDSNGFDDRVASSPSGPATASKIQKFFFLKIIIIKNITRGKN